MNVHPSLLPSFGGAGMYGIRVHQAAIEAGVRVTGVTVHFVDEEYDRGPIIAQWPVPVLPGDTPETLAERVLAVEHTLYPDRAGRRRARPRDVRHRRARRRVGIGAGVGHVSVATAVRNA